MQLPQRRSRKNGTQPESPLSRLVRCVCVAPAACGLRALARLRMQFDQKRREVIALICDATALPIAARAQQTTMPVVGFLHSASPDGNADRVGAFREGEAASSARRLHPARPANLAKYRCELDQ